MTSGCASGLSDPRIAIQAPAARKTTCTSAYSAFGSRSRNPPNGVPPLLSCLPAIVVFTVNLLPLLRFPLPVAEWRTIVGGHLENPWGGNADAHLRHLQPAATSDAGRDRRRPLAR